MESLTIKDNVSVIADKAVTEVQKEIEGLSDETKQEIIQLFASLILKNLYNALDKKYNFPDFVDNLVNFGIDKIDDIVMKFLKGK